MNISKAEGSTWVLTSAREFTTLQGHKFDKREYNSLSLNVCVCVCVCVCVAVAFGSDVTSCQIFLKLALEITLSSSLSQDLHHVTSFPAR